MSFLECKKCGGIPGVNACCSDALTVCSCGAGEEPCPGADGVPLCCKELYGMDHTLIDTTFSASFTITDSEHIRQLDDFMDQVLTAKCSFFDVARIFSATPTWGYRYGYDSSSMFLGWYEPDDAMRKRIKDIPPVEPAYLYATGRHLDNACYPLLRNISSVPVWGWTYNKHFVGWLSSHAESDDQLRKRCITLWRTK